MILLTKYFDTYQVSCSLMTGKVTHDDDDDDDNNIKTCYLTNFLFVISFRRNLFNWAHWAVGTSAHLLSSEYQSMSTVGHFQNLYYHSNVNCIMILQLLLVEIWQTYKTFSITHPQFGRICCCKLWATLSSMHCRVCVQRCCYQ